MLQYLFFIIFFLILFFLLFIGSFSFILMLNKFYLKYNIKQILNFTLTFNLIYLILYIITKFTNVHIFSIISRLLNYYLGFLLYGFIISILFWIIFFIFKIIKKEKLLLKQYIKLIFILFFLFINILAIYNFEKEIKIERYNIESNKILQNYSFIHISDIQYGSVNKNYIDKVMNLTYSQNPDFIVFTGDLIDFNNYELEDFKIFKKSKVPIYFERGNHEFYHNPQKILNYLQNYSTIKLLINTKDSFKELEIIGIDHNQSYYQLNRKLNQIDINNSKFNILLYHEPKGVEFGIEKEIDLMLFGHTHAGQIWPFTILIDKMYKYGDGYFEINKSIIYTTDGVSLWGPKMRLDSQNEITIFNLISIE